MSLLREIIDAAVDSQSDLSSLLRKCRILATSLKNDEFKRWVDYELDGYPTDASLPGYRVGEAACFGDFSGPMGSGLRNAPIPLMCVPEDLRDVLQSLNFHSSVAILQDMVKNADGDAIKFLWPADFTAYVGPNVYRNMNLMQAWRATSVSSIVGILETVRNRILNFALEIESESPNAGENVTATSPVPQDTVSHIYNTYIMGNVGNVASGSTNLTQNSTITISKNDIAALKAHLRALNIDENDVNELEEAIRYEPRPKGDGSFGARVSSWIGKMIVKSAQGAWNVSTAVASGVLIKAINAYYGLE